VSSVVNLARQRTPRLRLYVAGETAGTLRARNHCRSLERHAANGLTIEEIDVLRSPALAESAGILATPTLSDDDHVPPRRIVGDLGDIERVLDFFGLDKRNDLDGSQ
jgi:circadian clock protein KaiB